MSEICLRWDSDHEKYTCMDGVRVFCKFGKAGARIQKNVLLLRRDSPPTLVVNGTQMNRNITSITSGS